MKPNMKKVIYASSIALAGSMALACVLAISAQADDNMAACEIVLMAPVLSSISSPEMSLPESPLPESSLDMETGADLSAGKPKPMIATFLPADKFVFSVFDNKPGHLKDVDGVPIRALMCTRSNVLPTEFDVKLIKTGISLHLSQDFDSADSALLSIHKQNGKHVHQYAGPDLSKEDMVSLKAYMKKLNMQDKNTQNKNTQNKNTQNKNGQDKN